MTFGFAASCFMAEPEQFEVPQWHPLPSQQSEEEIDVWPPVPIPGPHMPPTPAPDPMQDMSVERDGEDQEATVDVAGQLLHHIKAEVELERCLLSRRKETERLLARTVHRQIERQKLNEVLKQQGWDEGAIDHANRSAIADIKAAAAPVKIEEPEVDKAKAKGKAKAKAKDEAKKSKELKRPRTLN